MARVWISPLTSSPLTSTQTKQYGFTVITDKPVSGDDDGELSPIEFYLDRGAGVPTYLQLVHQVDYALRLGFLAVGDRLPRIKDVTRSLAVNPDTVMKAYRELEVRGIAAGRPGLGTFIVAAPEVAGLREMAALRDFHYGGGAGGRRPDREARDRGDGAA